MQKIVVVKFKVFVATFIALIFSWIDLTNPNQNTVQSVQVFTPFACLRLFEIGNVLIVLRQFTVMFKNSSCSLSIDLKRMFTTEKSIVKP